MKVQSLTIRGFRSFASLGSIVFDKVNVLIGENNSGKSSILKAMLQMQEGFETAIPDVRVGFSEAVIEIGLREITQVLNWPAAEKGTLRISISSPDRQNGSKSLTMHIPGAGERDVRVLPGVEPQHFIVPYLSKRKTAGYDVNVSLQHAMAVASNMTNLTAKLVRLSVPSYFAHRTYWDACQSILGFVVTAVPWQGGMKPAIYLPSGETISIDQMGEGVPNITALVADIATSTGKLFLIEEPENDLHPTALKALLDLIITSSQDNQFVVSTHSNIVLRHLGSVLNSRVYRVSAERDKLPTEAKADLVASTPAARLEVLRELGYTFSDFDLWDGWLILEESSAERIIRDFLIPFFAPRLSRIRTLAAGGVNNVPPTFEDFNRLARFTHLEAAYRGRAWVAVDGDDVGRTVVEKLRQKFSTWNRDHFSNFSRHRFEDYYPQNFKDEVAQVFAIQGKDQRRAAKADLLVKVVVWLDEDRARAKRELADSAAEIVGFLRKIEKKLADRS